jgi:AbrB family looped-hinge helix DNA binding protein
MSHGWSLADLDPLSYSRGKMTLQTRLTSKGQVVIPKALRERMKWRKGTRLEIRESEGGLVLSPQATAAGTIDELLSQLHGCLTEGDPVGDLEREHVAEVVADEQWIRPRR